MSETHEADTENARFVQGLAATDGELESPVDLDISYMKVIELSPLQWINIDVAPRKVKITNTGYTVILSTKWHQKRPYLCGGPFAENYIFSQIHFHWGENEMNGSEHYIDGASMPMELHAVHFKSEYETLDTALRRPDGVTILVYFIKNEPNKFMEEIVKNLASIQSADSSVRIVPVQLTNIIRPFDDDYFLYWGSIVTISNVHKILWVISRVPIGVSVEQNFFNERHTVVDSLLCSCFVKVAEFRTLTDERGVPILSNIRVLKERQDRNIFHVCPSGSTYASLLPLPRDFSNDETDEPSDASNDIPTEN